MINTNKNTLLEELSSCNDIFEAFKVVIIWSRFAGIKFHLVQPGQISPYDYMWKLNFVTARRDNFPPGICLDLHAISFEFFFVTMSVYEIENPEISIDLKVQSFKLKKHWQMIAYVLQKYPENFAFQLFIILL